jgi:hypothetical protein
MEERKKEFKHSSGVNFSKELSEDQKGFIKSMEGLSGPYQNPMLVDKICVLKNEVQKLSKTTTIFSIALIFFAIIQVIIMLKK